MSFLLRVALPDRPGALGAVATALGGAGGDILSVDVVERGTGTAVDDLVVELPTGKLPDSLVSAATGVPGVVVRSIRPYAGRVDPHRELRMLDRLAHRPDDAHAVLADGVTRVFRAGWSLVLAQPRDGVSAVLATGGGAPELTSLPVPWVPIRRAIVITPDPSWAPGVWDRLGTELAAAPLGSATLLAGRPMMAWTASELIRLHHLAAIAATVVDSVASTG